jgi:hypothetical protein
MMLRLRDDIPPGRCPCTSVVVHRGMA